MTLLELKKKKHIYKKYQSIYSYNLKKKNITNICMINLKRTFFEFIYFRIIKKLIRKKFKKKKNVFYKAKYWVYIKPNFLIKAKTKNARMGAGVGGLIRVNSFIKINMILLKFKRYNITLLKKIYKILIYRLPLKLLLFK